MSGLLDGLEGLGLGKIDTKHLYEETEEEKEKLKDKQTIKSKEEEAQKLEEMLVFNKKTTCPHCEHVFMNLTVKNGKAKLIGTDQDLRPRHEGIDMAKYEVIVCPKCGYAALTRYFDFISDMQAKLITEKISKNFKGVCYSNEIYSYEEAFERYKLALANAVIKQSKASEKAYICLRTAWLLRGMEEELSIMDLEYEKKLEKIQKLEENYLSNALEGFEAARASEGYPMCGMDEATIDYIIAVLSMQFGKLEVAARLISSLLVNPASNARLKDRARELKDMLVIKIKEKKSSS